MKKRRRMHHPTLATIRSGILARVPFQNHLRRIHRRVAGYTPDPSNIGSTLDDLERLWAMARREGPPVRGVVLEIGAGWFPISGIIASLMGASRVILTDVTPHMDQSTFETARGIVLDRMEDVARRFGLDPAKAAQTLAGAATPGHLGIEYRAPVRWASIPDGSVDIILSRACLEHIPPEDLMELMVTARSRLSRKGLMAHAIDHSDHHSHGHPEISPLHFLTRRAATHQRMWDWARDGENRLRHHQYAGLFRDAGWQVLAEHAFTTERAAKDARVDAWAFGPPFQTFTPEQNAVVTSWFVLAPDSKKPPGTAPAA